MVRGGRRLRPAAAGGSAPAAGGSHALPRTARTSDVSTVRFWTLDVGALQCAACDGLPTAVAGPADGGVLIKGGQEMGIIGLLVVIILVILLLRLL